MLLPDTSCFLGSDALLLDTSCLLGSNALLLRKSCFLGSNALLLDTSKVLRIVGQSALLRHKLRAYGREATSRLRVYMAAECRRADDPRFHVLPMAATLDQALQGKAVVEFPVLHVALPASRMDGDARFPLVGSALPEPVSGP